MGTHKNFKKIPRIIAGLSETNSVALAKIFSIDMLTKNARDTPVDTGAATANWVIGINKEPSRTSAEDTTASASPTVKTAEKDIENLSLGDDVYIKNSVQGGYIIKLENGGSRQAPTGFFYKNLAQWKRIVKRAEKKIGL